MIAQLKEENRGLREEMSRAAQIPEPARTTKAGELDLPDPTGAEEPLVPPFTAPPKTLVVRSGDTLSSIAARVYGDSSQWQAIFEANRVLLVRPGNVRPGQMLVIPVLPQRRSSP